MAIIDFDLWAKRKNLSKEAITIINQVRESEPSRKVRSTYKNVSGVYPSKKMGLTIQFESHTLELAGIYEKEHDNNVLEYYDQPPSIKLEYKKKNKNLGHYYTADYFVISEDWIGWEEWKTEEELIKLSNDNPNRYYFGQDGIWHCPPGERYANKYGLSFKVRNSNSINWSYQRNIRFIEDYLLDNKLFIDEDIKNNIINITVSNLGITLTELIKKYKFDSDYVYSLVAKNDLYIDFYKNIIAEPERTRVFANKAAAEAYYNLSLFSTSYVSNINVVEIAVGKKVQYDGRNWSIVEIGENKVMIIGEDDNIIEIPISIFEQFINKGKISSLDISKKVNIELEILSKTNAEDLEEANYKFNIIKPKLSGDKTAIADVSERTIRYWIKRYKDAEETYGNGFIGLIPNTKNKGNKNRKLSPETLFLMNSLIEDNYETPKQSNANAIYNLLVNECEKKGWICPSYRTFCTEISKRPNYEKEKKRKGTKAAYKIEQFYYSLEYTTPRHGDRPFEICHLDHTELDVELICSSTRKNLGRPWLTLLIDAYTRRILSMYLTFDSPSYKSAMMVLRDCVIRHNRLPQTIVVDGGKEFQSVYFDTLLARYSVTKKVRPPSKSRFGSIIERMFNTTNERFINNLLANTQITKNVRQITKEVNPKYNAVWNFENLNDRLAQFFFNVYDTIDHSTLGQSPREAFEEGIALTGKRNYRFIPYDETFQILTLPTTIKRTAKVFPGRGIKINRIYYWSETFLNPEVENEQLDVRYDPFNMGVAFAYVQGKWEKLHSQYYNIFSNRSEKEIQIASEELKRRNKLTGHSEVTAKKLAEFLTSIESDEILLTQRLKDEEFKKVFKVIDGGKAKNVNKSIDNLHASKTITIQPEISIDKEDFSQKGFAMYEDF